MKTSRKIESSPRPVDSRAPNATPALLQFAQRHSAIILATAVLVTLYVLAASEVFSAAAEKRLALPFMTPIVLTLRNFPRFLFPEARLSVMLRALLLVVAVGSLASAWAMRSVRGGLLAVGFGLSTFALLQLYQAQWTVGLALAAASFAVTLFAAIRFGRRQPGFFQFPPRPWGSWSETATLSALLIGVGLFRFYGLTSAEHPWEGETVYGMGMSYTLRSATLTAMNLTATRGTQGPLCLYIFFATMKLLGISVASFRVVIVLTHLLTVLGVYQLGKRLFDGRVGILASALFAFSPPETWWSRSEFYFDLCTLVVLWTAERSWAYFQKPSRPRAATVILLTMLSGWLYSVGLLAFSFPLALFAFRRWLDRDPTPLKAHGHVFGVGLGLWATSKTVLASLAAKEFIWIPPFSATGSGIGHFSANIQGGDAGSRLWSGIGKLVEHGLNFFPHAFVSGPSTHFSTLTGVEPLCYLPGMVAVACIPALALFLANRNPTRTAYLAFCIFATSVPGCFSIFFDARVFCAALPFWILIGSAGLLGLFDETIARPSPRMAPFLAAILIAIAITPGIVTASLQLPTVFVPHQVEAAAEMIRANAVGQTSVTVVGSHHGSTMHTAVLLLPETTNAAGTMRLSYFGVDTGEKMTYAELLAKRGLSNSFSAWTRPDVPSSQHPPPESETSLLLMGPIDDFPLLVSQLKAGGATVLHAGTAPGFSLIRLPRKW